MIVLYIYAVSWLIVGAGRGLFSEWPDTSTEVLAVAAVAPAALVLGAGFFVGHAIKWMRDKARRQYP